MDEHRALERRVMMRYDYMPDLVKRGLKDLCAKPPDRFELCLRSVIWNDYCAWNLVFPGLPSERLGHVSGTAGIYSALLGIWTGKGDRIACASNLEGAGGLQILQFQKDLCGGFVNVQADERRSENCALDPFSSLFNQAHG